MKKILCLNLFLIANIAMATMLGDGWSGRDGRNGTAGTNGQDVTLYLDGSFQDIYLPGGDGGDADYGTDGGDATSCYHSSPARNIRLDDGGRGGDGGNGGNGGNGGSVFMFYKNISELKNVRIVNNGGRPGRGARGGDGGRGCNCSPQSWTVRECRGSGDDRVCDTDRYSCADGRDGRHGSNGRDGSSGRYGAVTLVKDLNELPSEVLSMSKTIFGAQQELTFVKNHWSRKSGLIQLLAPGSIVSDMYYNYEKTTYRQFRLDWRSARSIETFKNYSVNLYYDGNRVSVQLPQNLMVDYEVVEEAQKTVLVIKDIYTAEEAKKLSITKINSYGKNLTIEVTDASKLSDLVKSQIKLQFVYKRRIRWFVVYDELVPQDALTITKDKIVIHVGKLGIDSYINKGMLVRFTVDIKRDLYNNSTSTSLFQDATVL